jgi:hypothetical protein
MADQPDRKRLELNPTQVAASSLGAVTSAVAASYLGVGGTLAGAGVGSVVATVGGAVYGHYLEHTRQRVRAAIIRTSAHAPVSAPQASTNTTLRQQPSPTSRADSADAPEASAGGAPAVSEKDLSEKDLSMGAWLRSRRLALGVSALATFGLAVGVITGVEAITRKPVSAVVKGTNDTGSSTLGELFAGGRHDKKATPTPTPTPTFGSTGQPTPTATMTTGGAASQPGQTPPGEPGTTTPEPAPGTSRAPTPAPTAPGPATPAAG